MSHDSLKSSRLDALYELTKHMPVRDGICVVRIITRAQYSKNLEGESSLASFSYGSAMMETLVVDRTIHYTPEIRDFWDVHFGKHYLNVLLFGRASNNEDTIEWLLNSPPKFHTFDKAPLIVSTEK
jgi:hypothetical protein